MNEHERMLARDHDAAVRWAREVLAEPEILAILDSETTGLRDPEFVEVAVIDGHSEVLFESRVQPGKPVEDLARMIHGISDEELADAPTGSQRFGLRSEARSRGALAGRRLVIYNAAFDGTNFLASSCRRAGMTDVVTSECAMERYAAFVGEWHDYWQSYTWQSLPGGDHTSVGDCQAVLRLLGEMAGAELRTTPRDRLKETCRRIYEEACRRIDDPKNVAKGDGWCELDQEEDLSDMLYEEVQHLDQECREPIIEPFGGVWEASDILTVMAMMVDKAEKEGS